MTFMTLDDLWSRLEAQTTRGIRFVGLQPGAADDFRSYAALFERARAATARLASEGVGHGERVLISARTGPEFVVSWLGLMLRGAVPVPVPPSEVFAGGDVLAERVRPLLPFHRFFVADSSDVAMIRAQPEAEALRVLALEDVAREAAGRGETPEPPRPEAAAFVQYTSGSTSRPRGIVISYRNLLANVNAIARALPGDSDAISFASWLPLYHDMGLVGKLLHAIVRGVNLTLTPPQHFARRPLRFLQLIEEHRATHVAMPNFALEWLLRAHASKPLAVDLSSLSWWGVGSEPVSCETLRRFCMHFAPYGLRAGVLGPCYGLAEATLAVSLSHAARPYCETVHEGRCWPSAGPLVDGVEVRIDGAPGAPGRLHIRGETVAQHAYVDGDKVPLVDAQGWYDTKDVALHVNDQLVILGRSDEMFLLNGQNHFPYDIERVVNSLPELETVRCVCFALAREGGSEIMLIAEQRGKPDALLPELEQRIRAAVFERVGLRIERVVFVPPSSIPVTTSGKLRRAHARELFARGELSVPARAQKSLVEESP